MKIILHNFEKFVVSGMMLLQISVTDAQNKPRPIEFENLLSEPKPNETRPAWWYDVWHRNGVIVVAEATKNPQIAQTELITLQNDKDKSFIQYGLNPVKIEIRERLQISSSDLGLNSHGFKKGTIFEASEVITYKNVDCKLIPIANKEINGKSQVILLSDIGLAKPGFYYIKWSLPLEYKEIIGKIINARNMKNNLNRGR